MTSQATTDAECPTHASCERPRNDFVRPRLPLRADEMFDPRGLSPFEVRLEVEAQRSRLKLFIVLAQHMEQPGSRHSNPLRKHFVRAFAFRLPLHWARAGTTWQA